MKAFAAIISVHRQAEKDLFFIFSFELKNMKKSKTNQHPSRTICFASNTIKPAIREKKEIPSSRPAKQTSADTEFFFLRKVNLCGLSSLQSPVLYPYHDKMFLFIVA